MLTSLVTALIYSGSSIQANGKDIHCDSSRGSSSHSRNAHNSNSNATQRRPTQRNRKPFADLTLEERRQEFPQRLADALSAILFVAAETSIENRLRILQEITKKRNWKRHRLTSSFTHGSNNNVDDSENDNDANSDDDSDDDVVGKDAMKDREKTLKRVMETRAKLCPVCKWEEQKTNSNANASTSASGETIPLLDRDDVRL